MIKQLVGPELPHGAPSMGPIPVFPIPFPAHMMDDGHDIVSRNHAKHYCVGATSTAPLRALSRRNKCACP